MRQSNFRALHIAEICSRLKIDKSERHSVQRALESWVRQGLIEKLNGRRFRIKTAERSQHRKQHRQPRIEVRDFDNAKLVIGRLSLSPRGFGFVALADGGPDAFIPPSAIGAALHGDLVEIAIVDSPKGRDGHIRRVIERGITHVVGTLHRTRKSAWLETADPRMRSPMTINGHIPVGFKTGEEVIAKIVGYPHTQADAPIVEVEKALGKTGLAEIELEKIKIRENVQEEFPEEIRIQASSLASVVTETDKQGRTDLTHLDFLTIDPEDARDHDDAVYIRAGKDGFSLFVAIADVSHYVVEKTAIDHEAAKRTCSIYLPDRAIPMLPPEISSNIASLVDNQERLALVTEILYSETGVLRKKRFHLAVIKSRASLTYEQVASALGLANTKKKKNAATKFHSQLELLATLALILRKKRAKRGALNFDLPEAKVQFDSNGQPIDSKVMKGDPAVRQAYSIIEECMLATNEVVGEFLAKNGSTTPFRVHGTPDEAKLELFARFANALGFAVDPAELMNPKNLSRFLRRIEDNPLAYILNGMLLRAMQQACYQTVNIGHFGLASQYYVHFTSPIRRYPDLITHRVLKQIVFGLPMTMESSEEVTLHCAEASRMERIAMQMEREIGDVYRCIIMKDSIGQSFDAQVTAVTGQGVVFAIQSPYVECFCPVHALEDDFYELDDYEIRWIGRKTGKSYGLGDQVIVRVEEVLLAQRQIVAIPEKKVSSLIDRSIPQKKFQNAKTRKSSHRATPSRNHKSKNSKSKQRRK